MTHSIIYRKRGPFPQNSDFELDISAEIMKSAVHASKKNLTLAHCIPKLQAFEFRTRAYLGFEIYFSPVAKLLESPHTSGSRYMCTMLAGYYAITG